jgi:predicted PhzF superfamily epimerase YddE/YHI9
VARNEDWFEMDFPAWPPQPSGVPPELLAALGLESAEVLKSRDYLVVVDHARQVASLAPDIRAIARIEMGLGGVIVTAPGEDGIDYVARFFAPSVGIDEDPATGSINCSLAPYWAKRLGRSEMRVRQLSARGGALRCTTAGDRVKIAGQARLYLEGVLTEPVERQEVRGG